MELCYKTVWKSSSIIGLNSLACVFLGTVGCYGVARYFVVQKGLDLVMIQ